MHSLIRNEKSPERTALPSTGQRQKTPTTTRPLLTHQRALGNQAVQRFAGSCPLALPAPSHCPFGGACHQCPPRVQAKLTVSQPGDRFEQEADRIAKQVMRMPAPPPGASAEPRERGRAKTVQRFLCQKCNDEEIVRLQPLKIQSAGRIEANPQCPQRKPLTLQPSRVSPSLHTQIYQAKGAGQRLDETTRSFMENRFGSNFGRVRIHDDDRSHRLASSLGARAFTVGEDIFFHGGQYQADNSSGRLLLAHELVHTIQQTDPARQQIQPARFQVGQVTIHVDYGPLMGVTAFVPAVENRFIAFTGAANAVPIHAGLTALAASQQEWVLFALKLLQDNTQAPLHNRLNRITAVQRLIAHAPGAVNTFLAGPLGSFSAEEEALRVSGWLEVALEAGLSAPTAADRTSIGQTLNPTPAGGPSAVLNTADFRSRMDAAVRHLINYIDPANYPATGTHNLPTLQVIGDELMREAKDFFSPYAHTSRATVFGLHPPFRISANIFSVTAPAPNRATRMSYLRNRATIVGHNTSTSAAFSDRNIFHDVNFNSSRAADRFEFDRLITTLEAVPAVAAAVNRLIRHTPRQSGTGAAARIGLSTEYNAARYTACQARWHAIDDLCHEIMHALAHPDFIAQASNVGFGQVLREGFPEVLGVQMFNQRVTTKAATNSVFKSRMEAGITPPPCPAPTAATIGYGEAGAGAEQIRTRSSVGDRRFRAAFFLGQTHLIGL